MQKSYLSILSQFWHLWWCELHCLAIYLHTAWCQEVASTSQHPPEIHQRQRTPKIILLLNHESSSDFDHRSASSICRGQRWWVTASMIGWRLRSWCLKWKICDAHFMQVDAEWTARWTWIFWTALIALSVIDVLYRCWHMQCTIRSMDQSIPLYGKFSAHQYASAYALASLIISFPTSIHPFWRKRPRQHPSAAKHKFYQLHTMNSSKSYRKKEPQRRSTSAWCMILLCHGRWQMTKFNLHWCNLWFGLVWLVIWRCKKVTDCEDMLCFFRFFQHILILNSTEPLLLVLHSLRL